MNLDRKWGPECEGAGVLGQGCRWPLSFRDCALDHNNKCKQGPGTTISFLSALISFSEKNEIVLTTSWVGEGIY